LQRLCKGGVTVCEEKINFAINKIAVKAIKMPDMAIFHAFFDGF
jgi:hypothetical protein